ncbi:MAG: uncharacterized protein QOG64_2380 [Acidimicrobiaceae bacterium]|nr:uncharacterized protein [Acidimicrobiaceae bacterium]
MKTSGSVGSVAELWRYPVKSMLGERLDQVTIGGRGVTGDRQYAVVDRSDGKVASAKNPAKWRRLLEIEARFVDEPDGAATTPVELRFPDGSSIRSDDPEVDSWLSRFTGREVSLATNAAEGSVFEEVWPREIEGLAPADFVASTTVTTDAGGDAISDLSLAMAAPPGTFFDLSAIHAITTSTLAALRASEPAGDFDVRRYRPNIVISSDGEGFVENAWVGSTVRLGESTVRIDLSTMRCVMTTLAQPGMAVDRATLRTIARENRVEIPGLGVWACAGVYGTPVADGTVAVGTPVSLEQ